MSNHDIIVIAASAGGVEALSALVRTVPAHMPAAIFVMLHHREYTEVNMLAEILGRIARMPVVGARDGEPIATGKIYVAHPGRHLIVRRGHIRLTMGPTENRARPAADALFRSAALSYGPRVIGVVMTGLLDDGAAGLRAIKLRGGLVVVQEPRDALFPSMPRQALRVVEADACVPIGEIPATLVRLAAQPAPDEENFPIPPGMEEDVRISEGETIPFESNHTPGERSPVGCPDCGGWMLARKEGPLLQFRCHTGHIFSPESLLDGQDGEVKRFLGSSLRAVDELIMVTRTMIERARSVGRAADVAAYEQRLKEA